MSVYGFSENERIARLRLSRSERVGPVTFRELLGRFRTGEAALQRLPELARKGGGRRSVRICSLEEAERELQDVAKLGGRILVLGDTGYPHALAAVEDAPPVMHVLGDAGLLERKAVAVVGARNASANARRFAEALARALGEAGYQVVSGLARGIDAAAHQGALETGTTAVLAGGADVIYPPQNERLYRSIRERGGLVSEVPLGTQPQARHFPRRNRLISGLSKGVVVVEAALRSGSLITARYAADQGREVMAVPGFPLDPRAKGTNGLIKQGATLVESAEDVLAALAEPRLSGFAQTAPEAVEMPDETAIEPETAGDQARLLELLGPAPVAVDELVRRCHLSPAAVSVVLLELELAGRLERHPGGRVSLVAGAAPNVELS